MELGGQEDVVATTVDGLANHGLGLALRVDISGINAGDPGIEGCLDDANAFGGTRGCGACAEIQGAQCEGADQGASASKRS
ncbi:hypothetical protein D3C87_2028290 [compost metagenome]